MVSRLNGVNGSHGTQSGRSFEYHLLDGKNKFKIMMR